MTAAARKLDLVVSSGTDPRENLRLEDRLLSQVDAGARPETLRLWVNAECFVRGPHRSATSGWHRPARARSLGVPVYRRTTGGGTVYHDLGNLNWSFYLARAEGFVGPSRLFGECAGIIAQALRDLGIDARFALPNRIDAGGRKISGLASRAVFGAVLVHGTLLVASDLDRLNAVCIPPPGCPPVVNLSELVPGLTIAQVVDSIAAAIGGRYFALTG